MKNQNGELQNLNPGSAVRHRDNTLYHRDTGNKADPYTEPNSSFSDFSDSLNLLNLMKVLLHLGKTPTFINCPL